MAAESYAPSLDISALDVPALQDLREAIDERIARLEAERREEGFHAIDEIARRHGLSKNEIAARFGGRNKKPRNPPKYRNRDNPSQSWTGIGRKPKWVEAHLACGGTLEELAL